MTRIALLFLGLLLALPAWGEVVDRIAAVVNDEIITTYQLEQALTARRLQEELPASRSQVLESLIEEALIRQKVSALNLKISDEELEAAIEDVQQQNQLTRPQLLEALRQQGMSFADYQDNLRRQMLRLKLISREVQSQIDISDQEIRDAYNRHSADYRQAPQLHLRRLSLPLASDTDPAATAALRQAAAQARAALRSGESFEAVLERYALGYGADGGDMGTVNPAELSEIFAAAVAEVKAGGSSEVIETASGFHLLQVLDRRPGGMIPLESVREELRRRLAEGRSEEGFKTWVQKLRAEAYVDLRP